MWIKTARASVITIFLSSVLALSQQPATSPDAIQINTLEGKSVMLRPADFTKVETISATGHDATKHRYEGESLRDVLNQAGALPKELRGKEISDYVVAEARDGYHAVFSLAELDPEFGNTQLLVARAVDGEPIPADNGPLRLVVPGDKRQARWVRQLKSLTVRRAE